MSTFTAAKNFFRIDQGTAPQKVLSAEQVEFFKEEGYLVLPGFYSAKHEIEPIQRHIHMLIGLLIQKYDLRIKQLPFSPETFDTGYQDMIAHSRAIGGEIYDAIKQIPAFVRLVGDIRHEQLMTELRGTDLPGVAGGGYGIRIDNPNEEKFRAPWHQEYPAQFRSLDGLVYWSSLVEITNDIGPVEICPKSHQEGLIRVHTTDPENPEKKGAYALRLENEQQLIAKYPSVSPLVMPGDLVVMDFLTLHRSGRNVSTRSRWSMQCRYFNFKEASGVQMKWVGGFAAGTDLKAVRPDIYID
jgi:hypothetical protein